MIKREKGPELVAWRTTIHRQFLRAVGTDFEPANCPVRMHVVFTMVGPRGAEVIGQTEKTSDLAGVAARVCPSTKPDLDKLVRAVGDALSPRGDRGRLFEDDCRIVELLSAESFASPEHCHPWALPFPGAVIRVCPVDVPAPFLGVSLIDPGDLPEPAQQLLLAA